MPDGQWVIGVGERTRVGRHKLVTWHLAHDRQHAAIGNVAARRSELFLDHAFTGCGVVVSGDGVRRETSGELGRPQGGLEQKPDANRVAHVVDYMTPVLPVPETHEKEISPRTAAGNWRCRSRTRFRPASIFGSQ